MALSKTVAVLLLLATILSAQQVKGTNIITFIISIFVHEPESELCEVSCVKDIYHNYCGGAQCVYGITTEYELDALCSDTCLYALSGDVMIKCLEETKFEDTFDRDDARNILVGQVTGKIEFKFKFKLKCIFRIL